MKENAIIIRQLDVIKTYVDFSDIDNIYQAINAERVSTIHTAKTQELSSKLGVHLMGFVDREGDDINNKKACEISGYDYLGSFMLLCKTDDKFNALPFTEAELESVYNYLTTGEVKSKASFSKDELGDFLRKYNINPVLPNFSIKPEVTFFDEYPKIVLLTYNFGPDSGADLGQIGGELFKYSDVLVKNFFEEDGAYVSPEETYCVKNKTDMGAGCFYLLLQVLQGRRDQPIIGNIDSFLGGDKAFSIPDFEDSPDEPEEMPEEPDDYEEADEPEEYEEVPDEPEEYEEVDDEDVPEEYEEVDEPEEYDEDGDDEEESNLGKSEYELDWMFPYIIKVELEAEWPNLENTSCNYIYAYPLLQYKEPEEDQPYFPYFEKLIKLVDFDYFGDSADIKLRFGDNTQKVHLELDEPQTFNFDYKVKSNTSRRVGKVTLTLEKYEIDFVEVEGEIHVEEYLLNEVNGPKKKSVIVSKDKVVLTNLSNKDDSTNDCIGEGGVTGSRYFPWLISDDGEFILMNAAHDDYDDENIRRHIYIPIHRDQQIITNDRFQSSEDYPANIKVIIEYKG